MRLNGDKYRYIGVNKAKYGQNGILGVSPEYENEYDSYFVVRGGVETTVICDHIFNNS